jgi:hypothetical protein
MSDVTFDEDQSNQNNTSEMYMSRATSKQPFLVKMIIKAKLAKTERGANVLMVCVSIVCLLISWYLFFGQTLLQKKQVTYIEDIPQEIRNTLPPEILKSLPSRTGQKYTPSPTPSE